MRKLTIIILIATLSFSITNANIKVDQNLNKIINSENLSSFYNKLDQDSLTVEILHIGDSHIQGHYLPNLLRTRLQEKYGNAGRGLVFPYRLAHTNGNPNVHFSSNTTWKRYRIITKDAPLVGESGYNLYTSSSEFYVRMKTKEDITYSNVYIKGKGLKNIRCGIPKVKIKPPKTQRKNLTYKVKRGDYLGKIARKFRVSIKKIKYWNKIRSNTIRAGQHLKILLGGYSKPPRLNTSNFEWFTPVEQTDSTIHIITDIPQVELYLVKEKNTPSTETTLHSFLIKNNTQKGLIYNSIGVNGAKFIDYNTSEKFFSQLDNHNPALIIVSLGTNEAFDKVYALDDFKADLKKFCEKVTIHTGCNNILFTTPPTALIKRRYKNKKLPQYRDTIRQFAGENGYAVWDLYSLMKSSGGMNYWYKNGLARKDRIHFSKKGYELQGDMLYDALINQKHNNE